MKRGSIKARHGVLGAPFLLILLLALTPLGPWALSALAVALAKSSGWDLEIGAYSGALAGEFTFEDIQARNGEAGLDISVRRLAVAPWDYSLAVDAPHIRLDLTLQTPTDAGGEDPLPARLPLDYLPSATLRQGALSVEATDWRLEGRDLALTLTPPASKDKDAPTRLIIDLGHASLSGKDLPESRLALYLTARLQPQRIQLDSLSMLASGDSLEARADLQGRLDLTSPRPLQADLDLTVQADNGTVVQTRSQVRGQLPAQTDNIDLILKTTAAVDHPQTGPLDLALAAQYAPPEARLDSLVLPLWEGRLRLQGSYDTQTARLEANLAAAGIDLSRLPQDPIPGYLDGTLRADIDLADTTYRADADLAVDLRGLEALPGEPLDLRLDLSYRTDQRLDLTLKTRGVRLGLDGQAGFDGHFDLTLDGQVDPRALLDLPLESLRLQGRVRPDTSVLQVRTPHLTDAAIIGPVRLDAHLVDWRGLTVDGVVEDGLLQLRAKADLESGRLDSASLRLRPLGLGRLAPGLEGTLSGSATAAGPFDGLHAKADLALLDMAYGDWRLQQSAPLRLAASYGPKRVRLTLRSAALKGSLEANLTNDQASGRIALDGRLADRLAPGGQTTDYADARGTLDLTVDLQNPDAARAALTLDRLDLLAGGWTLTNRDTLKLRYADAGLHLDHVYLQAPTGPLQLSGYAHADSLALTAALDSIVLEPLAAGMRADGRGHFEINGDPQRLRVHGTVDLPALALDSLSLGDARLQFDLADSLLVDARLTKAAAAEPRLEIGLRAAADQLLATADTAAAAGALQLDFAVRYPVLDTLLSYYLGQPATGALDMAGALVLPLSLVSRPLDWRGLDGAVVFKTAQIQTLINADSIDVRLPKEARLDLRDDHIVLSDFRLEGRRYSREAGAYRDAGSLDLAGSLYATTPSRLSLDIRDLDLEAVGGPPGQAQLQASVTGTSTDPRLESHLDLQSPDIGAVRAQVTGDNGGSALDLTWHTLLTDSLTVSGRLPWSLQEGAVDWPGGRLAVQSTGIKLLALADQLSQLDTLGGRVRVDLELSDFTEDLRVDGVVHIDSLHFALLDIQPTYLFPGGRLEFSGQQARLVGMEGRQSKGAGRLDLEARMDLKAPSDSLYVLGIRAQGLELRYEDIFKVPDLSASIDFSGDLERSRASGRIGLTRAVASPPLVEFNAPPVPPPPPTVEDEFLENMRLSLFVDIRELEFDSELAKAKLGGGIDIGGTFYKPVFQGDVNIAEGHAFLLGNRFDFTRGRIGFDRLGPTESILDLAYDPTLLNPELDVEAVTRVKPFDEDDTYTVNLNLQGPALEVTPELSSTPVLETGQILYLLTFNTVNQANSSYTVQALGTTAGQLLSSRVNQVGFDEFNLLPSGSALGTVNQPSLLVGKYFKDLPLPLWIRYEAALRELSAGEVRLEHQLNDYFTVTGSAQSAYDRYGVGIGLKKEY